MRHHIDIPNALPLLVLDLLASHREDAGIRTEQINMLERLQSFCD
jgi:hypothetical protein